MRTCIKCGRSESETPFKPKRNLCMDDWRKYKLNYDKKTGQSAKVQKWKVNNRVKHRATCRAHHATPIGNMKHRLRVQKTWRSWFDHLLSAIRKVSNKPGPHDPKTGAKRECTITLDYVLALAAKQHYRCAVLDIDLVREMGNLESASIDRIDSKIGHIEGNIQITSQYVNYGKRDKDNAHVLAVMEKYYQRRIAGINYYDRRNFDATPGISGGKATDGSSHTGADC